MNRRRSIRSAVALLLVAGSLVVIAPGLAQMPHPQINPELTTEPWTADWIAWPGDAGDVFGVYHFRKSFDLPEPLPRSFVVHVSADNRYRLFVNGTAVAAGPARGDLLNWHFETVDISPHLKPGSNALAAVVWNFAEHRPVAQHTFRTGFVLQGDRAAERIVDTDSSWKVIRNNGYAPMPIDRAAMGYPYIVVGPGEQIDGAAYPWEWNTPEYDDGSWDQAVPVRPAIRHWGANYGEIGGWRLTPRTIPMMEARATRFERVVRATNAALQEDFVSGSAPLEIAPHTRASILLDHGVLTTAYPELVISRGAGSRVEVTYAEALVDSAGRKGHRDVVEGKVLRGIRDVWLPDGGADRLFRPLWFRTYRYVQIDVETAAEPLTISDVRGEFTAYPFEERATFASSDRSLEPIWDTGWRTARLCAGETYFDCPYYEQLQYVGDTRIQALISLYVAGDDRLMRQAIEAFGASRLPDGLTQSRYPSYDAQLIPPYSLFWIVMVHDFWMYRRDDAFVEEHLNGVRGVVEWYEDQLDPDGLPGPTPWWNFVDWSFPRGVPPGADEGGSSIIALQFVYALDRAAELADAFGRRSDASHYSALGDRIRQAVFDRCWDERRRLIADTPAKNRFSQHANVMAVLVDAVPQDDQQALMQRVLGDESLVPCTYYYRFYLDEAARKAGLGGSYVDRLDAWHEMLDLGLTTFAEEPEPTRSDAHAWSASPNYHFLATVCGIRPSAPGFERVRVEPALGRLEWVRGAVPHPAGEIIIELRRRDDETLQGFVDLPPGIDGELVLEGEVRALSPGRNAVGGN